MKRFAALLIIPIMLMTMLTTVVAYDGNSSILKNATLLEGVFVDDIFSEGLARVAKEHNVQQDSDGYTRSDYKYGFIDKSGNLVIDYIFDSASHFRDGRAWVAFENGDQGYIDKEGKPIITYKVKYYGPKEAPYDYYMEDGEKYYYQDYKDGISIYDGYYSNRKYGKYIFDTDGKVLVHLDKFDLIRRFHEGKAIAEVDGRKVAIDTSGNILFDLPFERFLEQGSVDLGGYREEPGFKGGILIGFDRDDRMGAINEKGEMVIPFGKYDLLGDCKEGIIAVGNYKSGEDDSMVNTLYGYVNSQGEEIVPPKYAYTYPFNEGLGKFATGTYPNWSYGFVDNKGKVVINSINCMEMGNFSNGLAYYRIWKEGNYYGYINKKGETIVKPKNYSLGDSFENGLAAVSPRDDNKYGRYLIDTSGNVVFKTKGYLNPKYLGENTFQTSAGLLVLDKKATPNNAKIFKGLYHQ